MENICEDYTPIDLKKDEFDEPVLFVADTYNNCIRKIYL